MKKNSHKNANILKEADGNKRICQDHKKKFIDICQDHKIKVIYNGINYKCILKVILRYFVHLAHFIICGKWLYIQAQDLKLDLFIERFKVIDKCKTD